MHWDLAMSLFDLLGSFRCFCKCKIFSLYKLVLLLSEDIAPFITENYFLFVKSSRFVQIKHDGSPFNFPLSISK